METKEISKSVIKRLPRYYRYLDELREKGVDRISSGELSRIMHVTASQIRQDLNNFGGFGHQGYGYNVSYLYNEIEKILGLDKPHPMVVLGAGNLGRTLANFEGFGIHNFHIVGIFDIKPELIGMKIREIPVRMISELPEFLKNNFVEIGVLTLPKSEAAQMANLLVENGIRAIWNFAHLDLDMPEHVKVENVHLSESLMTLAYNLNSD